MGDNNKEILLTEEGYKKMEAELEKLKTETRAEIAERIKVALGFGDLSENSEYDEAKNAQAENEDKIAELEAKLRFAKIIDDSEIDTKKVQVGNTVKVLDMEFDEEVEYTIVGTTEADITQNKISNESPIGSALLGAKKNQIVEVQVPAGVSKYKILSITKKKKKKNIKYTLNKINLMYIFLFYNEKSKVLGYYIEKGVIVMVKYSLNKAYSMCFNI